ncbi:hypothetical protein HPB52_003125 [Rhipicephalus sanguineus]|uniref:Uncharacterized protein n=1 Tax=Rhipicephalus sanguineus TaxID=34632 RepID=A0A9D4SVK7_RHISA|nr:hypothetical protein HPB52_003125 [Rhipicephalus sanguineus]
MLWNCPQTKPKAVTNCESDEPSDAPDLKISLLKAVRFVYGAWYKVRQTTIQSCFRKAGFVRQDQPPSPSDSKTGTETADLTELWEHVATGDADSSLGGLVFELREFRSKHGLGLRRWPRCLKASAGDGDTLQNTPCGRVRAESQATACLLANLVAEEWNV